jgi:hypothetical protein
MNREYELMFRAHVKIVQLDENHSGLIQKML